MMKIIHGVLATTSIAAFLLGLPEGSRAEVPAALVKAAKAEGELTVIALPHDWCGYGNMLDGFKKRYGIKVNELDPDAHSGDEVEAIKVNKARRPPTWSTWVWPMVPS
jgi:putative spermidine/putrescine transport system substrate-binding protein